MAAREPKPICERIGQRVRERRKDLGLSMEALAARMEVSKVCLWEIEAGRTEPRAGTIVRLCAALDLSADFLLFGDEPDDDWGT